jgi:hypothetical protein
MRNQYSSTKAILAEFLGSPQFRRQFLAVLLKARLLQSSGTSSIPLQKQGQWREPQRSPKIKLLSKLLHLRGIAARIAPDQLFNSVAMEAVQLLKFFCLSAIGRRCAGVR